MSNKFTISDRVKWNTSQGETHGKIIDITGTGEDTRYKVKSDKTDKEAVHKDDALTKI